MPIFESGHYLLKYVTQPKTELTRNLLCYRAPADAAIIDRSIWRRLTPTLALQPPGDAGIGVDDQVR
jgi:hypothetical protein